MKRKVINFSIYLTLILLAGCIPGRPVPVSRTAVPPSPTFTPPPQPTATIEYPSPLLDVKPQPDSTLSMRTFVAAETGYGSSICIKYAGFSHAQTPLDIGHLQNEARRLQLVVDGTKIAYVTYMKADHTFSEPTIHPNVGLGHYIICLNIGLRNQETQHK
jgi:hypothetical protein